MSIHMCGAQCSEHDRYKSNHLRDFEQAGTDNTPAPTRQRISPNFVGATRFADTDPAQMHRMSAANQGISPTVNGNTERVGRAAPPIRMQNSRDRRALRAYVPVPAFDPEIGRSLISPLVIERRYNTDAA